MNKLNKILFSFLLIACLPFYAHASAKKAGDSGRAKGILDVTSICDLQDGYGAKVDSDGNLQVEVSGGISGSFTASDVTISSVTPGTTAALLGKAEDAAAGSGDTGVAMLAVRSDTAAVSGGTDGDYSALIVGAAGHLWVEQKGTVTEDAAATADGQGIYPFAIRTDSLAATAGTDGDNINLLSGAEGALYVMGNKAEDAGATGGDYGFGILGVRTDTLASSSGTTGDYSWINLSARGGLYVTGDRPEDSGHTSADYIMPVGAVRNDVLSALAATDKDYTVFQTGTEGALFVMGDQVEDTAASSGDYLMPVAVVRNDVLAALATTDGDYSTLQVDADGGLYVTGNKAEDAAASSGDYGFGVMAVRTDTLESSSGTTGDYSWLNVGAEGALYTKGNVAEDAAFTSGDYLLPVGAIMSTTLGTAGQVAGSAGDAAMLTVDARGALYVKGDRVEDAAHTTGDYILPIATQRLDVAASSSGTSGDYSTLNTNTVGAAYVSERYAAPSVYMVTGDFATAGKVIVPAATGTKKNRVYKMTFTSAAAESIAIAELKACDIYTTAGGTTTIDFGFAGYLQTTADTAITAISDSASAMTAVVEYSQEA
jgi:hypothetical protein